jgi:glycerophosphoryl diester phosphodiesterase
LTLLGYHNPARRLVGAVQGLASRPRGSAERRPVAVVGHRGAAREEAENTIPSFQRAIELGADAIETDVCLTRDGRFVLWHDCRPDEKVALFRQTGEEGYLYEPDVPAIGSPWRRPVRELALEDFRRQYGYVPCDEKKRRNARVPIALLEDLFAWMRTEPRLSLACLDVKLDEKNTAGARALAQFLREARREGRIPEKARIALLCPQADLLQALLTESRRESLGSETRIFADFEFPGALDFARRYGAECVSVGVRRRLRAEFRRELSKVLAARDAGRIDSVIVWNINDEKRLRELVSWNVDGILTDEAVLLRRIVGERDGSG